MGCVCVWGGGGAAVQDLVRLLAVEVLGKQLLHLRDRGGIGFGSCVGMGRLLLATQRPRLWDAGGAADEDNLLDLRLALLGILEDLWRGQGQAGVQGREGGGERREERASFIFCGAWLCATSNLGCSRLLSVALGCSRVLSSLRAPTAAPLTAARR